MKLIDEVSSEKLRGAFYTPYPLVEACLDRVNSLIDTTQPIRYLEPSSGDGAFMRGIRQFVDNRRISRPSVTCVELIEAEAAKCRSELARLELDGEVVAGSFFPWAVQNTGTYDAVVGNPPFIRYQFVSEDDRVNAEFLLRSRGIDLQGVSNAWIPFVLISLLCLKPGGAFAFVLPNEIFSTVSAGQVRCELIRHCESLQIDMFPRAAFPDILQDVVVLSGRRVTGNHLHNTVAFREHTAVGVRDWSHNVTLEDHSWTKYLLTCDEWGTFSFASKLPGMHTLSQVASISVAIVTGANDFFTLDDATAGRFKLYDWCIPLLGRSAESPGLSFTKADWEEARIRGKKVWLLDFSSHRTDPTASECVTTYLESGVISGLPLRYKCRIRSPWYRVPHIQNGPFMMAKRSHQHHRLIVNEARVFTTDTIYRGDMKQMYRGRENDLVAGFHNSLSLLSTELEGRTYGGGVLELVPSEIGRLTVPLVFVGDRLSYLDQVSRNSGGQQDADDTLIAATDTVLAEMLPEYGAVVDLLSSARKSCDYAGRRGNNRAMAIIGVREPIQAVPAEW